MQLKTLIRQLRKKAHASKMQYKLISTAERNSEQASKILNFEIKNSMENIEIIKVGLSHLEELQKIGKQTFFETFSSTNTEEDMQEYLEKNST